jgi:hypothetical protein
MKHFKERRLPKQVLEVRQNAEEKRKVSDCDGWDMERMIHVTRM